MSYDHYEVAKKIIKELHEQGHVAWADRLTDVMESGSTATEIFMGLRWNLQKFEKESVPCKSTTKKLIKELHSRLDRALG